MTNLLLSLFQVYDAIRTHERMTPALDGANARHSHPVGLVLRMGVTDRVEVRFTGGFGLHERPLVGFMEYT